MSLKYELGLCGDQNVWSKKENLLKVGNLLGVEDKTGDEIPNNVWNIVDMETEGTKLVQSKHIFKEFSEQIAYLIYPEHPTFNLQDNVPGTKVYQSLKEIWKQFAYLGRKETPVTAAIIFAKSFEIKHDRVLIQEQFS